jgi:hypothetical protein
LKRENEEEEKKGWKRIRRMELVKFWEGRRDEKMGWK